VLKDLYPGDTGEESPNAVNIYRLKTFGVESFGSLNKEIGFAYSWAQKLCGLNFLTSEPVNSTSFDSVSFLDSTLNAIERRFKSRITLLQQFSELERGMVSLPKHALDISFPKLSCTLKEWLPLTLEQLKTHPSANELLEMGVIGENWFMYKTRIERGSAELRAFVILPPDYPKCGAVFLLTLNWSAEKTSRSDSSLRDLEKLVNVICVQMMEEEERHRLLPFQMHWLCVGFDVLLESEQSSSGIEGPLEFPQGRIFAKMLSGRDHSKPYMYSPDKRFFTCI
jgi:THO complex subunit 5